MAIFTFWQEGQGTSWHPGPYDDPVPASTLRQWGLEPGKIRHGYNCPHRDEGRADDLSPLSDCPVGECRPNPSAYRRKDYAGAVLGEGEYNGYNDSDFYAMVWTGTEIKRVVYASTRGWTYLNGCTIDATPEIRRAADMWQRKQDYKRAWGAAIAAARRPGLGKVVRVWKGRKVPVGTTGQIVWIGLDRFKRGGSRAGLAVGEQRVFTDTDHLEVVNPWQYFQQPH